MSERKLQELIYTKGFALIPTDGATAVLEHNDGGNRGRRVNNSAIIAPIAHISTAGPYIGDCKRTSGVRYQRVETYSVYGG
ncbi:hypothetical protein H5410_042292 [Solanum commersonii]|uniref:Uncharacterized protein n=1 Tax=Solanum commersonii TaxID=4109 RepID=A0A9J5XVL5_SOLCO|nr:hypothetical protein H5410_042292 [Solanum commersonii]